ncbi:UNC93-like protein isoform X1 [Diorhabda carinulata]|uniref:UNC93-like protein isoform X1 n=2 Tax=Diorhabda carinulata TaxID=1163345 RepID=UPI0025A22B9A|nr:UNC93-like protein isoform X1 [Diorhabda carinulata]XP_057650928.1 UNC93-like protein isoform X1 [Diorhabda carinulata]XP_057650929.1 UNC93-like protein isoform X1 [Diorhabda carinulata]XP_057650930.1 UNC93-like protein isoform X1 [Diorhabda carinulata]XP_057650931.1 UNC93-like protein isoform X1 [Diorhabda carinulata]XP_057650932.1 UNC93-like protein isoform X1 [Diorhabda carinulata]XP_057650933.1 UNC93-like protein isoform X1 [Diorhabda carinulata]XP_057650934.1 UNC93-like protein isofo
MVYTISDNVESIRIKQVMDSKFRKIKTAENEEPFDEFEARRIWKNVLLIGFAFMIHFTAFWGASNLQSSVNSEAALGTFTLASIYGSLLLSNILLPALVMKWLGSKWTIALSFIVYMPFILSQFYPKFYTLIPAGLAVGLGGGPLWCAKCTYLTIVSEAYAKIAGVSSETVVTRFFGIFFMFYSFSQVWGNLISSAVLSSGEIAISNKTTSFFINSSESTKIRGVTNKCGANFCPGVITSDSVPNLVPPPSYKINMIASIYFLCMVAAVLIVSVGVDKMSRYRKGRKVIGTTTGWRLLVVTLKHSTQPLQMLILPIIMFIGAEQAFLAAEYTSAYVGCGWGISNIGFVMICFGTCNGIASILCGSLVKITGRASLICVAFILHVALLITLLWWTPGPYNSWIFFVVSALWGVCDALWLVQINSYSGILFPGKEEAAFSNFRLWESTGSVITYILSPYLCINIKIYLLILLLVFGVAGYTAVEYVHRKHMKEIDEDVKKEKFELVSDVKSGEVAD